MKNMRIQLTMIRHGATPGNDMRRYIGITEESLSDSGMRRLRERQAAGVYPEAELLFSSPMKRCLQTAELLYPNRTPILIEEWREIDFGTFEGKNYEELNGRADYQEWIDSGGSLPFPEGESRSHFTKRCEKGFGRLLKRCQSRECPGRETAGNSQRELKVSCILHGGTMMALLSSRGMGDYFDFRVENGGGWRMLLETENGEEDAPVHISGLEQIALTADANSIAAPHLRDKTFRNEE